MSGKRFGLIGCPVSGSLSPALFNSAYNGRYTYDLIDGADFENSFGRFISGYDGINVTSPFKEKAFLRADTADPECKTIGAANLLVKTPEGIKAYNTDSKGVIMSLAEAAMPFSTDSLPDYSDTEAARSAVHKFFGRTPSVLITGCGGAGKAAAAAAGTLGCRITLMNRSAEKAEALKASMPPYGMDTCPLREFPSAFIQHDIIIYTIPEGIPETSRLLSLLGKMPWQGTDMGLSRKLVLEAGYRTPFFDAAAGSVIAKAFPECRLIPGTRWLLHQAAAGYGLFTGESPDFTAMDRILSARQTACSPGPPHVALNK